MTTHHGAHSTSHRWKKKSQFRGNSAKSWAQAARDRQLAEGSPALAVGQVLARILLRARAEGVWATFLNQTKVFFDELIPGQLREGHLAGAAVSVVNDGHMVFAKGYGYADREERLLRAIPS